MRQLMVVEITWSEGSVPRQETYGPWEAADDLSHLGEIQEFMREWSRLTGYVPQRATMAIVVDPVGALANLRAAKESGR